MGSDISGLHAWEGGARELELRLPPKQSQQRNKQAGHIDVRLLPCCSAPACSPWQQAKHPVEKPPQLTSVSRPSLMVLAHVAPRAHRPARHLDRAAGAMLVYGAHKQMVRGRGVKRHLPIPPAMPIYPSHLLLWQSSLCWHSALGPQAGQ